MRPNNPNILYEISRVKRKNMHYNFIEIGTSDFDAEVQTAGEDDVGLCIDPILYYLNRLPVRQNVHRVLAGISNQDGMIDAYYIPEEKIKLYGMPWWLRGCNSIGTPHKTASEIISNWGLKNEDVLQKVKVPVYSVPTILQMYQVTTCDYLKIDTEGHDCIILESYMKALQDGIMIPAKKICFESNELTPKETVDDIIQKLMMIGYNLEYRDNNTLMTYCC